MSRILLLGPWQLRPVGQFSQGQYPEEEEGWYEQVLPAHWQEHPALANYAGRMVYRRRFHWPGVDGTETRVWLRCAGIFYWSSVYLNGHHLGDHEGYFNPQEYEVTAHIRPGENCLLIEVFCPDEAQKRNKRMIAGVFSHWNVGDRQANPGGIWLPVEIDTTGPLKFRRVLFHASEISLGTALLCCRLVLDATQGGQVRLRFLFTPENFQGDDHVVEREIQLEEGKQEWSGTLLLQKPALWWTWDLGDPALYRVTVMAVQGDQALGRYETLYGIRTFELRNWIPYLNGVRFFIRGSNYAPGDMRIARMNTKRCGQDIALAEKAHMNILRLHAHVEHPDFYEVADRSGMLVWQDFPLQWSYARETLPAGERQVAEMVTLLYNHPSVVVWCMHNEPIWQEHNGYRNTYFTWRVNWDTLQYIWNRFLYSWDREVLDTRLRKVALRLDPSRPAIRASGEIALPLLRRGTDTHFYFGWYAAYGPKRAFEWVRRFYKRSLRFVTEFGAQSFPNQESLSRFLPPDPQQVAWDEVAERYSFQPDVMDLWLNWRHCRSWEELITLSQGYQSELNRYYIDRLRFHKYRPTGGIVTFNLQDPSPAIQWSVVDCWRAPKDSYAALCRCFHPQYIFALLARDTYPVGRTIHIPVYVVNDAHQDYPQVRASAGVCEGSDHLVRQEWLCRLAADSPAIRVGRLDFRPASPGRYTLRLGLDWGEGSLENDYEIVVQK